MSLERAKGEAYESGHVCETAGAAPGLRERVAARLGTLSELW